MRLLAAFSAILAVVGPQTVYEKTAQFPKFRALLDLDVTSLRSLYKGEVTVFAPVDKAFQKFNRKPSRNLVSYHVAEGTYLFPRFESQGLKTVGEQNPPLWVTERDLNVYINNALVLAEEFWYSTTNQLNQSQILYAVDEVLDPMVRNLPNPTALDFLKHTSLWNIPYTAASFLVDVIQNRLEDFFSSEGKYTFFIPIDDIATTNAQLNFNAIKAHVVPDRVLFTRPSEKTYWFRTLISYDDIRVFVSMSPETQKHLVVAETINESDNSNDTVVTEIVFGNVPLQNGVAHLISKPLAVFPRRKGTLPGCELIDKFSADPNLNVSYFLGVHSGFNENFNLPAKFTFFVPSNAAWKSLGEKFDLLDVKNPDRIQLIRRVLDRHLVVGEIPVTLETLEKVTAGGGSCASLKTSSGRVCLGAAKSGADYKVTRGGVSAFVTKVNYECADGFMHVIEAPLIDDEDFGEFKHGISVDFAKMWKSMREFFPL